MHFEKSALHAALCAVVVGAFSVSAGAASTVNVWLQDPSVGNNVSKMEIVAAPDTVPAGKVTFQITNQSKGLVHEMLLFNAPASGKLPYDAKTQRVIESKAVKLVDTNDIKPGASASKTVALKPGNYLMICNQPAHYASGMETPFTVTR